MTPPGAHWTPPMHAGGESFHACHLAEVLLSIPAGHLTARAEATAVLDGIRSFLARTMHRHNGWIVDARGSRTPQTMYAYCVLPGLGLSLPDNWTANCEHIFEALGKPGRPSFGRILGVLNAHYLSGVTGSVEFRAAASGFCRAFLADLRKADVESYPVIEVAVLMRAVMAAVFLLDPRLVPVVNRAASEALATED